MLCALQHQDLAVTIAAQMKATADEVAEYRKQYQTKDEAAKQLRRRKTKSQDSESTVREEQDQQVLCCQNKLLAGCFQSCMYCARQPCKVTWPSGHSRLLCMRQMLIAAGPT